MDGSMDGWLGGGVDGWLGGSMVGWTDACMVGWMDGWTGCHGVDGGYGWMCGWGGTSDALAWVALCDAGLGAGMRNITTHVTSPL